MNIFDPLLKYRLSAGMMLLLSFLLALSAHHYYGQKVYESMVEFSVCDTCVKDSANPVMECKYSLPANMIPRDIKAGRLFNAASGLLIKFAKCVLMIVLLRTFIPNDLVNIIVLFMFAAAGGHINPPSYSLFINQPSAYDFRDLSGIFVIASLIGILRRKLFLAGVLSACLFLIHLKVGISWMILVSLNMFVFFVLKKKNIKISVKDMAALMLPFVFVAAVYSLKSFIGAFVKSNAAHFPLYMQMLKMEPDDYYFIYRLQTDRLLLCLMLCAGAANVFFYHLFIKDRLSDRHKGLFSHPLTVFTLVVYILFGISIALELAAKYIPTAMFFSIAALRIWSLIFLFGFISAALAGIFASLSLGLAVDELRIKITPQGAAKALAFILIFAPVAAFFMPSGESKDAEYGLGMYKGLLNGGKLAAMELYKKENDWVYSEEGPALMPVTKDRIRSIEGVFSRINWEIASGNEKKAKYLFSQVGNEAGDVDTLYFRCLAENARANLMSMKGNIWGAFKYYYKDSAFSRILFVGKDETPDNRPRNIPIKAYEEAVNWIRDNMPVDARFINAPHIDNFSIFTGRDAFFMQAKHEGHMSSASAKYAEIFLKRMHDALGIISFDILGIVSSNMDFPMVRNAFLSLNKEDFIRLKNEYPVYGYIFTEACHRLGFPKIFSNEYFAVYKIK